MWHLIFSRKLLAKKLSNSHSCLHWDEVLSQIGANHMIPFRSATWEGEPIPIRQNSCRIHTFHSLDVHYCSLIITLLSMLSFSAFCRALNTACLINSWEFSLSVLNSCCQLNMSSIFILIHHIHMDDQMTHHFFPLLFSQYVNNIWSMSRTVSSCGWPIFKWQ